VALLANAGYEVVASTGKADQADFLKSLGASEVIDRSELSEENKRPMLKEIYAGAIDVVGGNTLANAIKSLKPGCSVACCGLVQSPNFDPSVFPFILRGVNLLGVDSVEIPLSKKTQMWDVMAKAADLSSINQLNNEISLDQVPETLDRLFKAGMVGHALVNIS
jgi:acrylyl-CoA reductase (NADPH)